MGWFIEMLSFNARLWASNHEFPVVAETEYGRAYMDGYRQAHADCSKRLLELIEEAKATA